VADVCSPAWLALLLCLGVDREGLAQAEKAVAERPPVVASHAALSEDEAVLIALRDNPQLRLFRIERDVAAGQIITATALSNPTLGLDLRHVQVPDRLGLELNLKWTPPQPVEWLARRSQARARQSEVNYEIAEREWALATEVRIAHATLIELGEQRRLVEAALTLRKRISTAAKTRVGRGAGTRLDLNLVELAQMYAQRDLDEQDVRIQQAQSSLQSMLGVTSATPIPVTGSPVVPTIPAAATNPEPLAEQALATRPALQAAYARITQRSQAIRVETARRYPWLSLKGTYRANNFGNYPHDLQLGVDVSLPVLNTNAGPLKVAQAELAREQAAVLALVQQLTQRVYAACAELNIRRSILVRFTQDVLPSLQEHEQLLELAARGAEIDLVALLSGEEAVLRRRRDHSDARLAYRRAQLQLQAAIGQPAETR
jgi:outer membrane protein TolC